MGKVEIPIKSSGIAVVLLKKFDDEYKVLLLKRASSVLNDAWCYIGGGIEKGETAWEAAIREVAEETGLKDVSLYIANKFDQFYDPKADYIYLAPVFVGFVNNGQEVILNDEHSEYEWLTFKEAIEKATLPGNDEVLTFIEKHFVKKKPTELLRVGK
ncbi:NUDIX hydrolase [Heyndrickxia camelliae]|uniref:NUDIX hydrolase n=1 Tax=Heyndrickxia camelliae TaxID=1707093 RepID=A0A2N3LDW9_9BACI|nr:NUDIX domain-containing protein [Heyndrickxia camelliae]PKR82724.1 NUDIX hydrolase [Heyndrickxia camelliae]